MKNAEISPSVLARLVGPRPTDEFESNGCSAVPDKVLGLCQDCAGFVDVSAACHVHDWEYHIGGTEENRRGADRNLFDNMVFLGSFRSCALAYYRGVRFFGPNFYSYSPSVSYWRKAFYRWSSLPRWWWHVGSSRVVSRWKGLTNG